MQDFGEHLTASVAAQFRDLRQRRGWTLAQLAQAADVHASTVHLIEQGKRGITLATAARLAAALDVDLSDLIITAERSTRR